MKSEKDESFIEFIKLNSIKHYYNREYPGTAKLIYISVLIFLVFTIFSLPFIKVDIYIKARGIIRPVCEKTEITSLVSARICRIYQNEGSFVKKGNLIITLESSQIQEEFNYYKFENSLISSEIRDLSNLLKGNDSLMTSVKYRFECRSYLNQYDKITEQLDKARKEKERYDELFREKLISEKEYDDLRYSQSQLEKEVSLLKSSTMNRWQTELSRLNYQAVHTRSELSRIENELSKYEIIAPVSGRLDQLSGIYEGSVIHTGQMLATITPDTSIIGEVYVQPDDIGLLKKGQNVVFIIDAFDYREWGIIKGYITDIPDDFILIENQPVFKIKCMPDQDFLSLKNGIKGQLKKGMTFQARFIMAQRSVAHLLTGRLDRLLNPALSRHTLSRE